MPKSPNNGGNPTTINALQVLKGRLNQAVESGASEASPASPMVAVDDEAQEAIVPAGVEGLADEKDQPVDRDLPDVPTPTDPRSPESSQGGGEDGSPNQVAPQWPTEIPMDRVRVGGVNVRQDFDADRLAELQAAIATMGLLQPLVVAPEPGEPGYWHLIAGERRYRAIQGLRWNTVPVRVVDAPPNQWRLLMMAENVQRENFTLAEELHGYLVMIQDDHRSVAEIAQQVKISPSYVYTMIRAYRNRRVREAIDDGLIPSRRMLLEVSRVITSDGGERIPGIVDRVLRFLGDQHPTQAEFRHAIESWMLAIQLPNESPQSRRRNTAATVRDRERERIQGLIAKFVAQGDRRSLTELQELYQQMAEDLDRIARLDLETNHHGLENPIEIR